MAEESELPEPRSFDKLRMTATKNPDDLSGFFAYSNRLLSVFEDSDEFVVQALIRADEGKEITFAVGWF